MQIPKILHMNYDEGEFSYANNSSFQKEVFSNINKPLVEIGIKSILSNNIATTCKVLNVADLGCGNGTVPADLISLVLDTVHKICKDELKLADNQAPEVQMYLNDLPTNDFNSVFRNLRILQLQQLPSCYVMGAPGSFYGRLFPRNSLHLVHSNYALHWLSQVPSGIYDKEGKSMNKGNIASSKTSPSSVVEAYRAQFRSDFRCFLHCRSHELVLRGYMVLTLKGHQYIDAGAGELLCKSITSLISKGLIEEEKLDSFDIPMYFPEKKEVEGIIKEEGSFSIEEIEEVIDKDALPKDKQESAVFISKSIRAFSESLISSHFGSEVCDALYDELTQVAFKDLEILEETEGEISITVLLKKV